jgi:hypothetical protein
VATSDELWMRPDAVIVAGSRVRVAASVLKPLKPGEVLAAAASRVGGSAFAERATTIGPGWDDQIGALANRADAIGADMSGHAVATATADEHSSHEFPRSQ